MDPEIGPAVLWRKADRGFKAEVDGVVQGFESCFVEGCRSCEGGDGEGDVRYWHFGVCGFFWRGVLVLFVVEVMEFGGETKK